MNLTPRTSGSVDILDLTGRFDTGSAAPVTEWLQRATVAAPAQVAVNLFGA